MVARTLDGLVVGADIGSNQRETNASRNTTEFLETLQSLASRHAVRT